MVNNNSVDGVPMGGSFALDGGNTVFCCSAGAYVPVEQVLTDPLRRRRADNFPQEAGHGHMSLIHEEDETCLQLPERKQHFYSVQEELDFLTTQQANDMKTCSCCPPNNHQKKLPGFE